jgi:sugar lactone lactonase YvrE
VLPDAVICEAQPLFERRFLLGEGPGYDNRSGSTFWVDIRTGSLFIRNDKTGQLKEIQTGQNIGAAVPAESGKYVAAMTTGIYYVDDTGLSFICRPPELKDNLRINDGKCDPAGRFWFGTAPLFDKAPEGSLFCLNTDGSCSRKLTGVKVSNGLAWTKDGKTMYYIDTPLRRIDAFDFNMETGDLSNRRIAVDLPDYFPDGMTIDDEGKLWVALWGSGKVVRCDPVSGGITGEIPVPAVNVSSCCFAGENLDTLIITTSGEGSEDPRAGRVYYAKPGITGTPTRAYADT